MRKALFVGTGGASGLVVKANSKKERIAKATEKQLKLQQQQLRVQQQPQQLRVRQQPGVQQRDQARAALLEQLAKLGELRDSGVLTAAEFEAKKKELLQRI